MEVAIVYPHQLFAVLPFPTRIEKIIVVEDPLFFGDAQYPIKFHKQKIVLHRASTVQYVQLLQKETCVEYIQYVRNTDVSDSRTVIRNLGKNVTHIHVIDPVDYILEKRIQFAVEENGYQLCLYDSPQFLTTRKQIASFFSEKKRKHQTHFYQWQRERLNILLESDRSPVGGKWTYDADNRKKIPKNITIPSVSLSKKTVAVNEAREWVENTFSDYPGSTTDWNYPTTRVQALASMHQFFDERFSSFGDYEDAFSQSRNNTPFLFHSVLTPALNIGLLTPDEVVEHALSVAQSKKIPLNSVEGFIRQIVGWREYMRALYVLDGVELRTTNYFGHTKKMPQSFWNGTTGIDPVDDAIQKVHTFAYTHHIERLMVLGSFFLLCEFNPREIYKWFMTFFIDAYDWVMVPNVYGMSQYAAGPIMTTKPYICGSNYIRKMSDYKKGDWCDVWDGLYWRFISVHQDDFIQNPRMSMMVRLWKKMDPAKQQLHLQYAESFLQQMD